MAVFVDTSALYALLDRADAEHEAAQRYLAGRPFDELFVTHSHVLVETTALVQQRLGLDAVADLRDELMPLVTVTWVDSELHHAALRATLCGSRDVSLVDHTSFELMRQRNIRRAFAFDDHFAREGFELQGEAL